MPAELFPDPVPRNGGDIYDPFGDGDEDAISRSSLDRMRAGECAEGGKDGQPEAEMETRKAAPDTGGILQIKRGMRMSRKDMAAGNILGFMDAEEWRQ